MHQPHECNRVVQTCTNQRCKMWETQQKRKCHSDSWTEIWQSSESKPAQSWEPYLAGQGPSLSDVCGVKPQAIWSEDHADGISADNHLFNLSHHRLLLNSGLLLEVLTLHAGGWESGHPTDLMVIMSTNNLWKYKTLLSHNLKVMPDYSKHLFGGYAKLQGARTSENGQILIPSVSQLVANQNQR